MKQIVLSLVAAALLAGCASTPKNETTSATTIQPQADGQVVAHKDKGGKL